MKKIKLTLIGLCLIFALSACGKESSKTYTKEDLSNMSQKEVEELIGRDLESLIKKNAEENDDASSSAVTETESVIDATSDTNPYKATQEILDANWYSGKLQFRDLIIQFPTSVQELSELGFEYKSKDGYVSDYTYDRGERIPLSFYLNDKEVFTATISNTLKESCSISKLVADVNPIIQNISFYNVEDYNSADIYYPGGLQIGNSVELISERLGSPSETDDSTIKYGNHLLSDFSCSLIFYINSNSQTIQKIEYSVSMPPSTLDIGSLKNTTYYDIYCSADETYHSLTVNMIPDSYFSNSLNKLYALFHLDEQVYSFCIDTYATNYLTKDLTGTVLLSETDENGVTRTLVNNNDSLNYIIQSGEYYLCGPIYINNLSNPMDTSMYLNESILNAMTEIIRSMQLN
ncbi:MAG: hypothetical protein IJC02_09965 [Lachnospiraceae bacterium]|nr:hypothetical protein [Lachnospiraceae bacterium]